ncbi:MAG: NAD(P)-dependent oxidoreductase [Phycisphaerales bacterium]|nr:NAD(P)-dependent oxidoreductase [Phycisphaerales bacterium]
MRIYLASPLGFSEAGRAFNAGTLIPLIERLGHEVLDPWQLTDPASIESIRQMPFGADRKEAFRKLNAEIGRANAQAIDRCDAVLAVLDGVDVDSGTAAEIGYACAKGKPVIGYRGDFRLSADNEGAIVNLQVEYFIRASGGIIVEALANIGRALESLKRSEPPRHQDSREKRGGIERREHPQPINLEMNPYSSIIITGGNGMLAHAFVRNLAARGLRAVTLDRTACDIASESDVRRLFAGHRPTLLLNCAAHTKVDLCEEQQELADAINGQGVGHLARLAKEHGTFLVQFSTDFVFDGSGTRPYRTDDPVRPLSAYGRSKLLGEQQLQANAPTKWIIARTAWLYGRNGPCFPRTMIERGKAGSPLRVVNDQIGSPTYTEDLAAATLDLIDRDATGIWHLTNTGSVSWYEFARAALEEFGVSADLGPTTTADWQKLRPKSAIRPAYSVLDVEPFARKTGRAMRPWREALRDYYAAVARDGFA